MLMYTWMVWMERAPQRYDWAVKVLTFGRVDKIKQEIAEKIHPKEQMLDIGCGPGALGMLCLNKGANVIGLDTSDLMLNIFKQKIANKNYDGRIKIIRDSATQLKKHFQDNSLDVITSTMAVGEFPKEYLDYIFKDCYQVLKPGGRLLVMDEVWPTGPFLSLIYRIAMTIMYIPQFVLARRVTCPIKNLAGVIRDAGFQVQQVKNYPFSTFQLVVAEK